MSDLTTLAAVKLYTGQTGNGADALLARLITRESRAIEQWTQRRFPGVTMTAVKLNGTGSDRLMLPETPIIDVSALSIDGITVPVSADGTSYGYTHDDEMLHLVGAKFPYGRLNVTCSWNAGYQTSDSGLIPAGNTITPTEGGTAVNDLGVVDSNGVVFTAVAAGVYTFNAADQGRTVTMTYQYVPGAIEQACIDMVCQDMAYRDHIGVKSKTIGGEVVSFSSDGVSTGVQQTLKMFRKFVPV
jgi:hypothetical protein